MDYVKKFLQVEGLMGQGAFGRVLMTKTPANEITKTHNRYALKCTHPILRPQRLASELRYLRDLGGVSNVVQMHTAHLSEGSLFIVMDLIEHNRFIDFVAQVDHQEIVIYMKNLLIALEHLHVNQIMHRDIKPANFLYDRKSRKFLLVDFGLAQKVRYRGLFGTATNNKSNTPNTSNTTAGPPRTPTSLRSRFNATSLSFSESSHQHDTRREKLNHFEVHQSVIPKSPCVNTTNPLIAQSPVRLNHMNFNPTGSSPPKPIQSAKRPLPAETNDFNQMLKKLRVSNDEVREPVKLTVGAYESPVTNNESSNRTRNNAVTNNHRFSTPKVPRRHMGSARCDCRGKPKTCTICQSRPDSNAPKSGTPGFKAPEILLRYPYQTTAIDIWSAGVIFVCLLSGHSPFFRDVDDAVSLGEIITIFGSQRMAQAAEALGIRLDVEPKREPVELRYLCETIRSNNKDKKQFEIPDTAFDLLNKMLDPNPMTRITASDAMKHPWLSPSIDNHQTPIELNGRESESEVIDS